jgi:hypothetical protein
MERTRDRGSARRVWGRACRTRQPVAGGSGVGGGLAPGRAIWHFQFMRIKSEIWVKAFLRRCIAEGVGVYVTASGDQSAGAIYIHVDDLAGAHHLYAPAPAGLDSASDERRFVACFKPEGASEAEVRDYLRRQRQYDPDLWVVEIEDRRSRHFLGDELVALPG